MIQTQVTEVNDGEDFLPSRTYEFIDWLDKKYPHQCIKRGESIEDAWRISSVREVIDALIERRAEEMQLASEISSAGSRK